MALTLIEAAIETGVNTLEAATVKMFAQESPILEIMPFERIDGLTYYYNREQTLPGIGWRAIGQTWPESTGTINPLVERLMILGGEVKIDKALVDTQPAQAVSLKRRQFEMKVQAASNEFDRAFFEGDDLVDPNVMLGLRRRLTGNQVILAGSGGATLTLSMLDDLIDRVVVGRKVLFMNRALRRKVTSLVNAAGGSVFIQYEQDRFGRQVMAYNSIPIRIVETKGDGSTFLDFDEDPGDGIADTASIYCVGFGEDGVHGLYNARAGRVLEVKDFGELEAAPQYLGRIEAYFGMCITHPRAAARLRGITNT